MEQEWCGAGLSALTWIKAACAARVHHELVDALDRSDADDDVRVVIFTGRGRAFCAGADLSEGASTFARANSRFP